MTEYFSEFKAATLKVNMYSAKYPAVSLNSTLERIKF